MEFQAVLLAGSQGNRLYPLCEETPPCLLTVATRPLLHYQLDHLERTGFSECIIVTRTSFVRAVAACVDSWRAAKHGHVTVAVAPAAALREEKRLTVATSPASSTSSASSSSSSAFFSSSAPLSGSFHVQLEHFDGWSGTCSALRHVRPLLHTDFFCIQSDLITTIPLHHLADIHRSRDASVTALLLDQAKAARDDHKAASSKKKNMDDDDHDAHYIGLAEEQGAAHSSTAVHAASASSASPSSRIVYYKSSLDLEHEALQLHKPLLRRCQQLTMYASLKDAHLYLFAHWVLNVLDDKRLMMSVQADLVPYLVKSQYRQSLLRYTEEGGRDTDEALAMAMSHSAPRRDTDEVYRCYVFVSDDAAAYCKRATSIRAYRDMNAELSVTDDDELLSLVATENHAAFLSKHFPRAQLAHSFFASGVHLPPDAAITVRRSVVGKGAKLGGGVKVNGSVLLDGVVVEDGVVLTDSVVSEGCVIGKGSSVINCKLGPRYSLQPGSEHKNEVLCHERSSTSGGS